MRRWHAPHGTWNPIRPQWTRRTGGPVLTLLGEHAGEDEVREGAPFVGRSGAVLNEVLASNGIDRRDCDVDNGILCGLPKGIPEYGVIQTRLSREKKAGISPDSEQHPVQHCRPRLNRTLARARAVVPMGGGIAAAIFGHPIAITRVAGAPKPPPVGSNAVLTLPTISPAFVARQRRHLPLLHAHIGRALRFAQGAPRWIEPKINLFPSAQEVVSFLLAPDAKQTRWTYDLETTGINPRRAKIDCIGVGRDDPTRPSVPLVTVIPVRSWEHVGLCPIEDQDPGFGFYSRQEWARIEAAIREAFTDSRQWWGHNAGNYDRQAMSSNFPGLDPRCHDSLLYHSLAWSEWRHGLSVLASHYTDAPAWKDDYAEVRAGTAIKTNADRHRYCGLDVGITHVIEPQVYADARAFGQIGEVPAMPGWTLPQLMHELQAVGVEMSRTGIPVNQVKRAAVEAKLEIDFAVLLREAQREAANAGWRTTTRSAKGSTIKDRPFNPASVFHVRELLFDLLNLPIIKETDTGDPSTDDETLLAYLQKPGYAPLIYTAVRSVRRCRRTAKQIGMVRPLRLRSLDPEYGAVDADGRIRVAWNIHTPTTTRYASADPFNLQNVPKWMRDIFEAPDGFVFIGADQDALEGRLAAIHWNLTKYIEFYAQNLDTHQLTVELTGGEGTWRLPGAPPPGYRYKKEWPGPNGEIVQLHGEYDDLRTLNKRWFFASLYGAGNETTHGILKEVEDVDDQGNSIFPYAKLKEAAIEAMATRFHAAVPQLRRGWDQEINRVKTLGYNVDRILGRRRRFGDGIDASHNEILNHPIQTGGVGIVHRWMLRLRDALPSAFAGTGTGLCQQGHDALLYIAPESEADRVIKTMTETAIQTFPDIYPGMTFRAKARKGKTWKSVC